MCIYINILVKKKHKQKKKFYKNQSNFKGKNDRKYTILPQIDKVHY